MDRQAKALRGRRGERRVPLGQDRRPVHDSGRAIDKARHPETHRRKRGARHPGLGTDPVEQGFGGADDVRQQHRTGLARDRLAGDQIAGKIDHHRRVFAVGKLDARDKMRRCPHPERHRRTAAAGVCLARGLHLFEESALDQLRSERGHRCRADGKLAGKLNPRDQPGGAHPVKDLLAQRPRGFRKRRDERSAAWRSAAKPLSLCRKVCHFCSAP